MQTSNHIHGWMTHEKCGREKILAKKLIYLHLPLHIALFCFSNFTSKLQAFHATVFILGEKKKKKNCA
jgi:hypothetical protein